MQTQSVKFDYKEFFSNKILNEEFNSAMDAKSRQIFALFKSTEVKYAPLFGTIVNDFLKKIPVSEFFDG